MAEDQIENIAPQAVLEGSDDSGRDSPLALRVNRSVVEDFEVWPSRSDKPSVRQMKQADFVLNVLKQSGDPEQLKEALVKLKLLLEMGAIKSYLEENQFHVAVLGVMEHVSTRTDIQRIGCELLCMFMETCPQVREAMQETNFYRFLLQVIRENITDPVVQLSGMKMFTLLFKSELVCDQLILDDNQSEVVELIGIAITAFRDDRNIQLAAYTALTLLLEDDFELSQAFLDKPFVILLDILNASHDIDILTAILRTLKVIALNEKFQHELVEHDVHKSLIDLCGRQEEMKTILPESIELLCILKKEENVYNALFTSGFVVTTLCSAMGLMPLNVRLQKAGLEIIQDLAQQVSQDRKREDPSYTLINTIYTAMFGNPEHPEIQIAGCRALSAILEHMSDAHKYIGDNIMQKQFLLDNLCIGALLMYRKNEDVYNAACEALYWIGADNERLCTSLMKKNIHVAIIEGLKRFRSSPHSAEAGSRALRGLCIFHDVHKHCVVNDGGFSVLSTLLTRHPDDLAVQIEVIGAIACLADVDLVKYQCMVENVHKGIVTSMEKFSGETVMQEAGLEALTVLAAADCGVELLVSVGVLTQTIKILQDNLNDAYIQKKGFILLQLLAGGYLNPNYPGPCPGMVQEVPSDTPSKMHVAWNIAQIVSKAMNKYRDYTGIQTEACVLLQLLAEVDRNICEIIVEAGCHGHLFYILEAYQELKALQDLASEVLFLLSQDQSLKSIMLLSACKQNILAGTQCLMEMGADVNIGDGESSPLYFAVVNGNEDMVRTILKQEVRDLLTPLQKSLAMRNNFITGLILEQLGYDRSSRSINWNTLNLNRVEPVWFLTTFTNELPKGQGSDIGQQLLAMIRESEVRRYSRIHHSKSDSQLFSNQPQRLRFKKRHHSDRQARRTMLVEDPDIREPKTAVFPPAQSPFITDRSPSMYKRSKSVTTGNQPVPNLPTIMSTSPPIDLEEARKDYKVTFEQSFSDIEEWRKTTLTGANIPYSPMDPRQQIGDTGNAPSESTEGSIWMRKNCRSPRGGALSNSSSISSLSVDSEQSATVYLNTNRRPSAPVLSSYVAISKKGSNSDFPMDSASDADTESSQSNQSSANLSNPDGLISLDISQNKISTLRPMMEMGAALLDYFSSLQRLDLSENSLESLPDSLFNSLSSLHVLDLRDNKLPMIPLSVFKCSSLTELNLSYNKIKEFYVVEGNSTLQRLNLSHNQIKSLPSNLGSLFPKLSELLLNSNDLISLPEEPLNLEKLKRLDFSHNSLGCIPEEFLYGCPKLDTLEAAYNSIDKLPSENVSERLPKLSRLQLKRNHLAEKEPFFIPKFILDLPTLKSLDLSENDLMGLPKVSMWKTSMLKELLVSHNNIQTLNLVGAKSWNKLEKLHLKRNQISEIPREIGYLTSLSSLDISHNKGITTLPDELGKCSNMWELCIEGLDLDLDRTLLRGRVKDLIIYLHNKLKKARRYFRMKLMVVGYGDRGKSTLLQMLMKRYKESKENKPTVGVIVRDWQYERHPKILRGKSVMYTLNTWDFAGQEEFYSTHQCYLSNRSIYLVIYNLQRGKDEIERLKLWLSSIHSRAPGCPVIVVGTHLDKVTHDSQNLLEEITNQIRAFTDKPGFPHICGSAFVDCTKENLGLERLRNLIKDVIDEYKIKGQPVMGEKIPASYVRLAELLSDEAKSLQNSYPVITYGHLLRIVQTADLDLDTDELNQAIDFFHESGVLLHYNDTAHQLRNYYFIDPGWLCRMMAQVITVRQINPFISKDGIMAKKDIHLLFKSKHGDKAVNFPQDLIIQYLKLLEKFEIALPHSDSELLIPSHLPTKKPKIILPVSQKFEKTIRIYKMPCVPIGLWSRLVTRMIALTDNTGFKALLKLPKFTCRTCWRQGIYVHWNKEAFFLLDSNSDDGHEEILVTVPASKNGSMLLGHIVDHIDGLIEEWYPGLTSIDPMLGHDLLEKYAPCPECPDYSKSHQFGLDELMKRVTHKDEILCSNHTGYVLISKLAPDLVLGDLESALELDTDRFDFKESSEFVLGDGGFGEVYSATYKDQPVAVKLFREIADVQPLVTLRQEVAVLKCLKHPSVVSLLAVGIRPPVIVLELAPLGTLGRLLKGNKIVPTNPHSKQIHHRLASQVADGLCYLHELMIVYRDMKPDNVLIYSLNLNSVINAKISDYGISRFSTLEGLKAQEGTLAYRAPEVSRKEIYSFQADVFSFGLTLYVMLTNGRHPFDEYDSKGEMDRAIAEGLPIPLLTSKGGPYWPEMQTLAKSCLERIPDARPKAWEICKSLNSAELYCLARVFPISFNTTVECMVQQTDTDFCCSLSKRYTLENVKGSLSCAKQLYKEPEDLNDKNTPKRRSSRRQEQRLWIATGDLDSMQLSMINLQDTRQHKVKGGMFPFGRIMCLDVINSTTLVIGTQLGKIYLMNTETSTYKHCTTELPECVLCMKFIKEKDQEKGGMLLAGLANGKIAVIPDSELINEENVDPFYLSPGKDHEPVKCMVRRDKHVFATCGTQLLVMHTTEQGVLFDNIIETNSRTKHSVPIYTLAVTQNQLAFFSRMASSAIEVWDLPKEKKLYSLKVDQMFSLPAKSKESRVTALTIFEDDQHMHSSRTMWVGTGGGHIGIVDLNTYTVLSVTHRYTSAVRSLLHISVNEHHRPSNQTLKYDAIASGGLGFRERPGSEVIKDNQYGCVALWDADMPLKAKTLQDYVKRRTDLVQECEKS